MAGKCRVIILGLFVFLFASVITVLASRSDNVTWMDVNRNRDACSNVRTTSTLVANEKVDVGLEEEATVYHVATLEHR